MRVLIAGLSTQIFLKYGIFSVDGLCGNFDKNSKNDLVGPNNINVPTLFEMAEGHVTGECVSTRVEEPTACTVSFHVVYRCLFFWSFLTLCWST